MDRYASFPYKDTLFMQKNCFFPRWTQAFQPTDINVCGEKH